MTATSDQAIGTARGFLGEIALYSDRVHIVRHSVAGEILELLGVPHALSVSVIRLDRISGFEVLHPLLMPPLIVLQYPGSAPLSGGYWHDAVAENVHMMSFADNRDLDPFTRLLGDALRRVSLHPEPVGVPLVRQSQEAAEVEPQLSEPLPGSSYVPAVRIG